MKKITLPISDYDKSNLYARDYILLTGKLYTMREIGRAHV